MRVFYMVMMPVIRTVTVFMIVMRVLACGYVVVVTMYGAIPMRMPFGCIGFTVQARVFAEHQRFDRNRNRA